MIKRALRPPKLPWKQFHGKDNGPSGILVVTDREEGSGQHFLSSIRKVKFREGKKNCFE
jgi:hypothetical protein